MENEKMPPVDKDIPEYPEGKRPETPLLKNISIPAFAREIPVFTPSSQPIGTGTRARESGPCNKDMERLRGYLNYLRAYCQDLRVSTTKLNKVISKLTDYDPETCGEIPEFSEFLYMCPNDSEAVDTILEPIDEEIRKKSIVADNCADQIADIRCCWTRIGYCKQDIQKQPLARLKESLKEIDKQLCDLIVLCDQVTIPCRLNQHLENMRIGQQLNFYERFKDEICSKSNAKYLLDYLSNQPNAVHGLIDVESGIVYNASSNKWRQRWTYIGAALMILGGALAVFFVFPLFMQFFPMVQNYGINHSTYLAAYIFVILGGCVHILIDIIKEKQSAASKSRISLTDWVMWGHINEFSLIMGIVMLWVGFAGLVWINQVDMVSAVAVGYSIDSVYDVVVGRFDKGVTSRSSEIVKVMKGE
ncbi:MAG: hypothetical protein ABFC71_01985 [Methanoregula sp.]|jgi:hypothetical protein